MFKIFTRAHPKLLTLDNLLSHINLIRISRISIILKLAQEVPCPDLTSQLIANYQVYRYGTHSPTPPFKGTFWILASISGYSYSDGSIIKYMNCISGFWSPMPAPCSRILQHSLCFLTLSLVELYFQCCELILNKYIEQNSYIYEFKKP